VSKEWNLPELVCEAVRMSGEFAPDTEASCADLVCLANAVVKREGIWAGDLDEEHNDSLIKNGADRFGFSDSNITDFVTAMHEKLKGAE